MGCATVLVPFTIAAAQAFQQGTATVTVHRGMSVGFAMDLVPYTIVVAPAFPLAIAIAMGISSMHWVYVAALARRMLMRMGYAMTSTPVWARLMRVAFAMAQARSTNAVAQTFRRVIVIAVATSSMPWVFVAVRVAQTQMLTEFVTMLTLV